MIDTEINKKTADFFNEKIAKKILKNEKLGKQFSARIISDTLGVDYDEIYNSIQLSSEEIAFSSLTTNSIADSVYYNDKVYFNIEINGYRGESKTRQIESYVYQIYLGQLHTCKDYFKIKKVIQINIDLYDFLGYGDFIYNVYLMEKKHHQITSDKLQIIHINVAYLRKKDYNEIENKRNKLMKDLYFLICGLDKLDSVYERVDKLMKDIIDESKKIAGFEKMRLYLTEEEMLENDRNHYKELGREEKAKEMIVNLYNKNVDINIISESSGLTIKEIKKIIEQCK